MFSFQKRTASPSDGVVFEGGGTTQNTTTMAKPMSQESDFTTSSEHSYSSQTNDLLDQRQENNINKAAQQQQQQYDGPPQTNNLIRKPNKNILGPPPGLLSSGSFPPPIIDTSMPPPSFHQHPHSYNSYSHLSYDPFRPPPALPNHQPFVGSYPPPSPLNRGEMENSHPSTNSQVIHQMSMEGSAHATNAINIPPRRTTAIPNHIANDPTFFNNGSPGGSSAPNLGSSPMMSFSPSKISSQTLDKFSQQESSGVPLQTSWTFWIDRSANNATLSEYKAVILRILYLLENYIKPTNSSKSP